MAGRTRKPCPLVSVYWYRIWATSVQLPVAVNETELPPPDTPQPDQELTAHLGSTPTA